MLLDNTLLSNTNPELEEAGLFKKQQLRLMGVIQKTDIMFLHSSMQKQLIIFWQMDYPIYQHTDGQYMTDGWERINGKWYRFDEEGWMQTGWLLDGNTWYYMENNGAMACNETLSINGTSYSFSKSGAWYK